MLKDGKQHLPTSQCLPSQEMRRAQEAAGMETDAAAVHSRIECKRLFAHSGGIRIVIKALESLETAGPHHLLTGLEVSFVGKTY